MSYLEVNHYTKTIKQATILNDVSLSVERGEIIGLVGANGSGKTMLLRAVGGLIFPDKGEVLIDGARLHKDMSFPKSVGMVLENVGMWSYQTGFENLRTLADIKKQISDDEIRSALERVGLDPSDRRTYRKYSLGMKQRLAIAQAIMEKPDMLLLDEVTNGLDEDGVEQVYHIIDEERARGAVVLLASHDRPFVDALCDRVYAMRQGSLSGRVEGK